MTYRDLSDGQILAAAGGFATICGWLSYLLKVQEGKAFLWREFFLHGAISAVCGLISYEILAYEGFPPQLCGALSGPLFSTSASPKDAAPTWSATFASECSCPTQ